jgi:hypothetical protein
MIDLTGRTFANGRLKVLHLTQPPPGFSGTGKWWLCQCRECGAELPHRSQELLESRAAKKCLCKTRGARKNRSGLKTKATPINASHWSRIKAVARNRGIPFEVTMEEALAVFQEQEARCALSGLPIFLPTHWQERTRDDCASLDRIDSAGKYASGNIQWVTKAANTRKGRRTMEELIARVKARVESGAADQLDIDIFAHTMTMQALAA